uniref:leucine rich adaptor protein 1-like n=1 Tax=Monopterus albus TaxID=43700 RepID=UPI0009B3C686|nr:leucine rich adaptor protein 1-like [Monopterus albus]
MAEEILNNSFPDLKELENKVGRKTPQSLVIWMKDAAGCEDRWKLDVVDRGHHSSALSDSLSDKINNLKQEMRWLRSADVRILCQLVAVHEGIEAMRWMMENRGVFASRGSSLTDSLSSLVTVEGHSPMMSPCSPTCSLPETTGEESEDQLPHTDDAKSDHKSCFNTLTLKSTEARPPSASSSNSEASHSMHARHSDSVDARVQESQPQDMDGSVSIIRRALFRSSRARREVKADAGSFNVTKQSEKTKNQSFKDPQKSTVDENESTSSGEKVLLGYDAQWCWVESQDDVLFV